MNSAPRITLTREERVKLKALATGPLVHRSLAKRAQAILACDEGSTNLSVASEIGITNLTVGRWRRDFVLNRLKGFGVERRGRPVRALVLSSAERRTLQGWLRSPRGSPYLATRARVILTCGRGNSNLAVASETGVSEQTVSKLRQLFLSARLIGLRPRQPGTPAAPVTLSADERTTLENWSHTSLISSNLARRSQAILACANEKTNLEVAQELGLSGHTVGYMRRRFLVLGLDSLNRRRTTIVGRN